MDEHSRDSLKVGSERHPVVLCAEVILHDRGLASVTVGHLIAPLALTH